MDAQAPNKVPFVTHATLIMRARSEGEKEGGARIEERSFSTTTTTPPLNVLNSSGDDAR